MSWRVSKSCMLKICILDKAAVYDTQSALALLDIIVAGIPHRYLGTWSIFRPPYKGIRLSSHSAAATTQTGLSAA